MEGALCHHASMRRERNQPLCAYWTSRLHGNFVRAKISRRAYSVSYGDAGNGSCNESNNNEICGYDGGDCCECTCEGEPCESFACIDPSAPCVDDDDITANFDDTCDTVSQSDAYCDQHNNRPECSECGIARYFRYTPFIDATAIASAEQLW